jgi:hypothetical protein
MSKNVLLAVVLAGLIIFALLFSKSNLLPNKKTAVVPAQNSTTTEKIPLNRTIDINDVVADPVVYKDLTLTLDGRINNWVTKYAYTITGAKSSFGSSGKSLPIITRGNYQLPEFTPESRLALGEIANVRVTGLIVIFDRATLEQEWNVDLDDKQVDRWNKTPVMLLDKIEKL